MRLDEPARRSLYDALASALGGNQADTLMNLLPQHPLAELATRDDLHALGQLMRGEMAEVRSDLKGEMAELRTELKGEMTELRTELKGEMTELRGEMTEMRGEMAEMRGDIGKLSGELRAEFSQQVLMLGLLMGTSIIAVLGTMLTLGFTGAFA